MTTKYFLLLLFIFSLSLSSLELTIDNDISAWTLAKNIRNFTSGFDYKPTAELSIFSNKKASFDSKLIGNYKYIYSKCDNVTETKSDLDLYRCWLRFSTDQFQTRIGLQKINFGPARLLRSLQWFDTIDPLDEQKESSGVKALLLKYFFLNSSNIWFWGIMSDGEVNISQTEISEKGKIEFGGRVQYPFKYAEVALSFHARELKAGAAERRFGFDSRWDFGIGFWMETVVSQFTNTEYKWGKKLTLGADVTIPFGNGIYVLSEHKTGSQSQETLFDDQEIYRTSALLLSYPIGLLDTVKTIISFDWKNKLWIKYFSYGLNFDYLGVYLNFYWNSKYSEANILSGRSMELILASGF